jgi:hypothetical protein
MIAKFLQFVEFLCFYRRKSLKIEHLIDEEMEKWEMRMKRVSGCFELFLNNVNRYFNKVETFTGFSREFLVLNFLLWTFLKFLQVFLIFYGFCQNKVIHPKINL